MKICFRVQHAVGRDAALARLLTLLPPKVEVITDQEARTNPNPMRGYLQCLANPPKGVTHLCIVQDDVLPTSNFEKKVKAAVAEKPDVVISLFVGGLPTRTRKDFLAAVGSGAKWTPVYFREIHHVVGLVWPVTLSQQFLDWYPQTRIPGPIPPRSDDAVVGFWARKTHNQVWATVPCLVEHPDDFPSTIRGNSRFGERARRAIYFEP